MGKSESLKIIAIGCKRGLIRDAEVKYRISRTKEVYDIVLAYLAMVENYMGKS